MKNWVYYMQRGLQLMWKKNDIELRSEFERMIIKNPHPMAGLPWEIGHHDKNLEEVLGEQCIHGNSWSSNCSDCDEEESVLELGCGSGNDAIWFAKKGFNVTAVDVSSAMIDIAKEKSKGLSNIKYIVDDVHQFSTEERFDIIYDRGFLHNTQLSLPKLFPRLHQLLKDDGKMIILTGNPNHKASKNTLPTPMYIKTIEESSKNLFNIKLVKEIVFEQNEGYENSLGWLFILEKRNE